ncbi:MAG: hypothetical protein ABSH41_09350 [Syntrophobacteraceae bacterium]|jgi:hypothetical protein
MGIRAIREEDQSTVSSAIEDWRRNDNPPLEQIDRIFALVFGYEKLHAVRGFWHEGQMRAFVKRCVADSGGPIKYEIPEGFYAHNRADLQKNDE